MRIRYVSHIHAIVLGAKELSVRMIIGFYTGTLGHEKARKGAYRCPKVLGKPITEISPVHAIAQTLVLIRSVSVV